MYNWFIVAAMAVFRRSKSRTRSALRLGTKYQLWAVFILFVVLIQFLQIIWMEEFNVTLRKDRRDYNKDVRLDRDVDDHIVNKTIFNGRCRMMSYPWGNSIIPGAPFTHMNDWTFQKKRECEKLDFDNIKKVRTKVSLNCDGADPVLELSETDSSGDIDTVNFGDKCLGSFIDNCCIDENPVPNVVHYIWYTDMELGYFNFLSLMSTIRFLKPCLILIHGPFVPNGTYWDYIVQLSPNIIHVYRERPLTVFGNTLRHREHSSDVMRIQALIEYGGIYLDFDEVLLRPIDSLRRYIYTQGHERENTIGSQLVMAKKNAKFLQLWYKSYDNDYKKTWAYNALWVPNTLSKKYPDLIHIEGFNFTRPNWQQTEKIFSENYNWKTNYAMHMYARLYRKKCDHNIIRTLNTTIGSVSRHILFGNKTLCYK